MKPCPKCGGALKLVVRGHDNRSVEAKVYVVCSTKECDYEAGPFNL
jgi:ssDNA-binding Zn-finger/Zn-ribbon topoisomerase 1